MELGYVNISAVATSFKTLRQRRFTQGANRYDIELKARFRNESNTDITSPLRRYEAAGYTRNASGAELANWESLVTGRLVDEYAGRKPTPVENNPVPDVLPPGDRKEWIPFSYRGLQARSHFAPIVFANQRSWFETVPRCLKCRIIHDYQIVDEDSRVTATPNESCQCAEDIVYGKLRQLGRVGNVVLVNL